MIKQPSGTNVNEDFTEFQKRRITRMNEMFKGVALTPDEEKVLLWVCSWEDSTVNSIISAFSKLRGGE